LIIFFQIVSPLVNFVLKNLLANCLTPERDSECILWARTVEMLLLFPDASENITATAGKVRGDVQGGKMATGTKPAGVSDSDAEEVAVLLLGKAPPPWVPG
jgi:hypothetical protein